MRNKTQVNTQLNKEEIIMGKVRWHLFIPKELKKHLADLAEEQGRTESGQIIWMLQKAIKKGIK